MPLYTIIMDYGGGTYIGQLSAIGCAEAVSAWAAEPDADMLKAIGFGGNSSAWGQDLLEAIASDTDALVPIQGLTSVWYISFLYKNELVGVNVVETVGEEFRIGFG